MFSCLLTRQPCKLHLFCVLLTEKYVFYPSSCLEHFLCFPLNSVILAEVLLVPYLAQIKYLCQNDAYDPTVVGASFGIKNAKKWNNKYYYIFTCNRGNS